LVLLWPSSGEFSNLLRKIKKLLEQLAKNELDNRREEYKVPAIVMKNPLNGIVLGLVSLSVLLSIVCCVFYIKNSRELRGLQGPNGPLQKAAAEINAGRPIVQALMNEAVEYSKKNASIDPILQSIGINIRQGNAPVAPTPAAKPPTK
jgi:hypothetical protein